MARSQKPKTKRHQVAESASWLALVAATSLGVSYAETVRAEIRVPRPTFMTGGRYRLIVQSYDTNGEAKEIPASSRPRASAQRSVTVDDLEEGIRIDLVALGERKPEPESQGIVVAWVEPGEANLELDALRARPTDVSLFGMASAGRTEASAVEIILEPRRPKA